MEIECPECKAKNSVEIVREIKCSKCNASLNGAALPKKKGASLLAVVAVVGGAHAASLYFEDNRYPILVEHAVMEDCINQSKRPLARTHILKKREICACALERTEKDISEEDFQFGATQDKRYWNVEYLKIFEKNAEDCQ